MHRVAIVGSSGAGKSTVAEALEAHLGLAVIELDDLMHGPNWTPTPTSEFRAKVAAAIAATEGTDGVGGWVIPGNYRNVADLVQRRADTIVWLDLPRRIVTRRLVTRSIRRIVTKAEVCNGNREDWRRLLSHDPERNVVLWSWQHHDQYREIYEGYADGAFWSGAEVHRLCSPSDVDALLASISR
jgi:adenylate kinase family enzyme